MPYIKDRRSRLENSPREAENAGELNFAITSILSSYIHSKGPSYQVYNEVIGVLECAKLELYRRVVGKYEDQKRHENGDVFPQWLLGISSNVKLPEAEIVRLELAKEAELRHPSEPMSEDEMDELIAAFKVPR